MTTITGNARFREAVAARLVLAMRPDQSIADTAVPDAQSSPVPGDYSIQVDTHQVLLQAHAFDPAKLIGPWRSESVYAVGDVIFETSIDADALVLECTAVTGTEETGAAEPTWDTTTGNTTTDNDVTWEALGTISELSPLTQFLYQSVLLSAVNPSTGSVDGGTSVSLSGSGLSAFNAGNGDTITVDGNDATNISVVSDTEITFDTPASDGGATGSVNVVVTVGGESVTLGDGFEYINVTAYAELDPALTGGNLTIRADNITVANLSGNNSLSQTSLADSAKSSGKHYFEIEVIAGSSATAVGISEAAFPYASQWIGNTSGSYALWESGLWNNGSNVDSSKTVSTRDVVMIAVDLDAGKLWFGKNGAWFDSGDPAAGTGEQFSGLSGSKRPAITPWSNNRESTMWSDPADHTYSAPSGFTAGWTA